MAEFRKPISHKEICELGIPHSSFNCGRVRISRSDRSLQNVNLDVEEPPLQGHQAASGFTVDEAPTSSAHTAELFAQVRDNGRLLDNTRIVLGGSEVFDATFKLGLLVEDDDISNWSIRIQQWPRDLRLRKGLLSSLWTDLSAVVSARDAEVTDAEGAGVTAATFLRSFAAAEEESAAASLRWAVVLNDRGRLAAQLQGMPATAATLNGKPSLKR